MHKSSWVNTEWEDLRVLPVVPSYDIYVTLLCPLEYVTPRHLCYPFTLLLNCVFKDRWLKAREEKCQVSYWNGISLSKRLAPRKENCFGREKITWEGPAPGADMKAAQENTWTAVSRKEMSCFVGHVHLLKQGSYAWMKRTVSWPAFSRTQVDNHSFQRQRETENIFRMLSVFLVIFNCLLILNSEWLCSETLCKAICRCFVGGNSSP